ncbi:MAG: hypothetical protein EPN39_06345 [Chitinophagaceae bacterium]|nr:MAG: hypothetical protein EPN39_06345 [Chitinophagaceae bacterium]
MHPIKTIPLVMLLAACASPLFAQQNLSGLFSDSTLNPPNQPVLGTFSSPFIVNAQSNETLHKHDLNFYISHRFDDIAGKYGGVKTLFGLDNATDVMISFQYGISNRLTVGIGRFKGAPEVRYLKVPFNTISQLWYGELKYRLLQQTEDNSMPLAVTLYGNALASSMAVNENPSSDAHFNNFGDRWSFMAQAIIARKFSNKISFEVIPTYLRRNYVAFGDVNNMFALGVGGRWQFNRTMAIVADAFIPFRSQSSRNYFISNGIVFYVPISIGWEIVVDGHDFNINFTNANAISANQMIPYTTRNWGKGGFRWGFNLSRTFTLFEGTRHNWKK